MNTLKLFTVVFLLALVTSVNGQICPITLGTERIVNGNFSSGNTGFGSDFTYSSPSVGPGNYSVGTNPNSMNSFFANIGDHTSGSGNMLVVDVDATANKDAYNTTVNVTANTDYFFSAWFANINTNTGWSGSNGRFENSPQIKFSINNVQVGSVVKVDSVTHQWRQFFTSWNSGAVSGPITIRIENVNTSSSNGNDLALDDISFSTSCSNIKNLNTLGQSSALIDTVKNCNISFPYTLNPALPGTYSFGWRNSAGTLLTAPATNSTYSVSSAPADGTKYYLCYEYIAGCPRMDSVIFKNTPLSVELGPPITMCSPVSTTLFSGVTNPPVTVQWYKNGVPVATTANYTATDIGTYSVDLSRAGCGSASDNIVISNPASTISGSGTYCTSDNTSSFTVTGSSSVNWYFDNATSTVMSTSTTFTPPQTSTNTGIAGCSSGLFVADASSYPGTLIPATSVATAPCGSNSNYNGNADLEIQVSQSLTLTSVDYFQNSGWGNGTFTFSIFANGSGAGPWCSSCSPNGNYDGPTGTALYTTTTPTLTAPASGSLQRTLAVSYTLAPGRYWLRLSASSTAMGAFTCNRALSAGSSLWSSPFVDNTGNNVLRAISSIYNNGGGQGTGALFNVKFQVGASNTCPRLFICATVSCTAPVELVSFAAKSTPTGNKLIWKTSSEINSAHFVIERSYDGNFFESIGTVKAAGSSNSLLSYSFVDSEASPDYQIVYYRLKEVDLDNTTHYSTIEKVSNNDSMDGLILYPQPVKQGQSIHLDFMTDQSGKLLIEVFDVLGRVVTSFDSEFKEGRNEILIPTDGISSGLYHIRFNGILLGTQKIMVE